MNRELCKKIKYTKTCQKNWSIKKCVEYVTSKYISVRTMQALYTIYDITYEDVVNNLIRDYEEFENV